MDKKSLYALVGVSQGEPNELAIAFVPQLGNREALSYDEFGRAEVLATLFHVIEYLGGHLDRYLVLRCRQIVQRRSQRFLWLSSGDEVRWAGSRRGMTVQWLTLLK